MAEEIRLLKQQQFAVEYATNDWEWLKKEVVTNFNSVNQMQLVTAQYQQKIKNLEAALKEKEKKVK